LKTPFNSFKIGVNKLQSVQDIHALGSPVGFFTRLAGLSSIQFFPSIKHAAITTHSMNALNKL